MVKLSDLQEMGAVSALYQEISLRGVKYATLSQIESMSHDEQADYDGTVVLDNAEWVASIGRKPANLSRIIVSWDGTHYCSWHRGQRTISVQELNDENELATIKHLRLPKLGDKTEKGGSARMAQEVNLKDLDLEKLTAGVTNKPATSIAEGEKRVSKSAMAVTEIKQMIDKTSTVKLADRTSVNVFNQEYGRAFGFICRTDKAIKVAKASRPKLVDGKPVWKPDTPDSVKQKYAAEGKGGSSYMEKEKYLVFKEAKPSAPFAMIIGTPEGGDIDITSINSGEVLQPDRSKKSLKFHVLPMETAYIVLAALYDGKIKEDDTVLKSKATMLTVKSVASKRENATDGAVLVVRNSLTINKKMTGSRTTVLTSGNYVPLRQYETIPVSAISTEDQAAALNLNFEAALKDKKVEEEFPMNASDIQQAADGTVTSKYFSVGGGDVALFGNITKFDSKTELVSSIEIPVREKVPTKKDPTKFTYKYAFRDWDYVKTRQDVIALLNSVGLEPDAFKAEADKCSRRTPKGDKAKNQLTSDDILKLQYNSYQIKQGNADDIKTIAQKLAGIE